MNRSQSRNSISITSKPLRNKIFPDPPFPSIPALSLCHEDRSAAGREQTEQSTAVIPDSIEVEGRIKTRTVDARTRSRGPYRVNFAGRSAETVESGGKAETPASCGPSPNSESGAAEHRSRRV